MKTINIKYRDDTIERVEKIEKGDWIDLRCAEKVELKSNTWNLIPLGVAMELPKNYEAILAPRSSTFKKWGIIQTNTPGVIDNTYCGDDDWWFMSVWTTRDVTIEKNDRICQFRIQKKMPKIKFIVKEFFGNKNRGGCGSTGTK